MLAGIRTRGLRKVFSSAPPAREFPHLPIVAVFVALIVFDALFLALGLRQFQRKAVT